MVSPLDSTNKPSESIVTPSLSCGGTSQVSCHMGMVRIGGGPDGDRTQMRGPRMSRVAIFSISQHLLGRIESIYKPRCFRHISQFYHFWPTYLSRRSLPVRVLAQILRRFVCTSWWGWWGLKSLSFAGIPVEEISLDVLFPLVDWYRG